MLHPALNRLAVLALALATPALGQNAEDDELPAPLEQTVPVADEIVADEVAAEGQPQPLTEDQILRQFDLFQRYLADKNYDEADIAAKRIVEMAIRYYGPQTHETAKALNNLAIVQHQNHQYDAAVQNFTSAIETLEVLEDRLNESLVNPLKGLADPG